MQDPKIKQPKFLLYVSIRYLVFKEQLVTFTLHLSESGVTSYHAHLQSATINNYQLKQRL